MPEYASSLDSPEHGEADVTEKAVNSGSTSGTNGKLWSEEVKEKQTLRWQEAVGSYGH